MFQDDNASPHTDKRVIAWISNQPFHHMPWPHTHRIWKSSKLCGVGEWENSIWIPRWRWNYPSNMFNSIRVKFLPMSCIASITKCPSISVRFIIGAVIPPNTNFSYHINKLRSTFQWTICFSFVQLIFNLVKVITCMFLISKFIFLNFSKTASEAILHNFVSYIRVMIKHNTSFQIVWLDILHINYEKR